MPTPPLWERVKRARIVQVLLVYLGASWAVLQIADVLTQALELPAWVLPVSVLLLLVGLIIILATAWVQSLPSTTAAEEAGQIPTDWQIAPSEALKSLRAGKLPHLTWGRAILGGVVALSLLFGGAGMYVGFRGRSLGFGPTEASAVGASEGIAVVPFEVRGENLEIWREGMVDLLSNNLDGVGGFRTIDPRTVLARWKEQVGEGKDADLDAALRAAGATGARYALVGSVVGLGDDVRLVTDVYDLDTGEQVANGQAQGATDDVLHLVDNLAVGTVRSLLETTGREGAGDLTAETLTTESLPALRDFLEGERYYRKGEFAEAVQSFERAVAQDTSFAIGLVRLSEAYGWLEDVSSEKMRDYGEKAVAHAASLPPRYQFIMSAWDALNHLSADGLPVLKEAVQKYPDDPEAWFLLAETYIHVSEATYATLADMQDALDHAVALDPGFVPYWVHVVDVAILRGDRPAAEEARRRFLELGGAERDVETQRIAIPLLLGDSAEAAAALDDLRNQNARTAQILMGTYGQTTDRFDRIEMTEPVLGDLEGSSRDPWVVWDRVSQGAEDAAFALARDAQLSPQNTGILLGHQYVQWGIAPAGEWAKKDGPSLCRPWAGSPCPALLGDMYAREGRAADLAAVVADLRGHADQVSKDGNQPAAKAVTALADVLEGIAAWKRGRLEEARATLVRHANDTGQAGARARAALADMAMEAGRFDQAIHYAQSLIFSYDRPRGLYIQAKAYEAKGDTAKALDRWRHFVTLTRKGDDDVAQVREGREAVARLGG